MGKLAEYLTYWQVAAWANGLAEATPGRKPFAPHCPIKTYLAARGLPAERLSVGTTSSSLEGEGEDGAVADQFEHPSWLAETIVEVDRTRQWKFLTAVEFAGIVGRHKPAPEASAPADPGAFLAGFALAFTEVRAGGSFAAECHTRIAPLLEEADRLGLRAHAEGVMAGVYLAALRAMGHEERAAAYVAVRGWTERGIALPVVERLYREHPDLRGLRRLRYAEGDDVGVYDEDRLPGLREFLPLFRRADFARLELAGGPGRVVVVTPAPNAPLGKAADDDFPF